MAHSQKEVSCFLPHCFGFRSIFVISYVLLWLSTLAYTEDGAFCENGDKTGRCTENLNSTTLPTVETSSPIREDVVSSEPSVTTEEPNIKYTKIPTDKFKMYHQISRMISINEKYVDIARSSCKNICGQDYKDVCTCKPHCVYTKTCCYDFLNVCYNRFILENAIEAFSWLADVRLECVGGNTIISSCSPRVATRASENDSHSRRTNPTTYFETGSSERLTKSSGFSVSTSYPDMDKTTKSDISHASPFIAINAYLQGLSDTVSENSINITNLSYFQALLLSTPLLDSSTGLVYKNKSIFDCNPANQSAMKLLNLLIGMPFGFYLTQKRTSTLNGLLHAFSFTDVPTTIFESDWTYGPCNPDTKEESCPDSFNKTNDALAIACEITAAYINVKENYRSVIYKNPYCLSCHSAGISRAKYVGRAFAPISTVGGLVLRLSFSDDSVAVTVNMLTKGRPAWALLTCAIRDPDGYKGGDRQSLGQSESTRLKEGDVGLPTENSTCEQKKCFQGTLLPPCHFNTYVRLYFPPPNKALSSRQWQKLIADLRRGITEIFASMDKGTPPRVEFLAVNKTIGQRNVAHQLTFTFKLEVMIFTLQWDVVKEIVHANGYRFRFFCGHVQFDQINSSYDPACFEVDIDTMSQIGLSTGLPNYERREDQETNPMSNSAMRKYLSLFNQILCVYALSRMKPFRV